MTYNLIPLFYNAYLHTFYRPSLDFTSFQNMKPDSQESDTVEQQLKKGVQARYAQMLAASLLMWIFVWTTISPSVWISTLFLCAHKLSTLTSALCFLCSLSMSYVVCRILPIRSVMKWMVTLYLVSLSVLILFAILVDRVLDEPAGWQVHYHPTVVSRNIDGAVIDTVILSHVFPVLASS